MKRFSVWRWIAVGLLVVLAGCSRETIALPAPNVEWAPQYAAAELAIKAIAPEATLVKVDGFVEIDPANPAQRFMFGYTTPDFKSLTILVTQEKNSIKTTEIFSGTIDPGLENRRRLSNESPFPITPGQMSDYQRRAAKVRISPGEAVTRALAEEPAGPLECSDTSLVVTLVFQREPDAPVWFITRICKSPADASVVSSIFYDVNSETGQVLSRKEVK